MDILYLITDLELGGAERSLYFLSQYLKEEFRIEIAVLKKRGELEGKFMELGLPLHHIGSSPFVLKNLLARRNPKILHSFLPRANFLSRFVSGGENNYFLINSQRAVKQRLDAGEIFYVLMEKLSARRAGLIVANSFASAERIRTLSGLSGERIRVIHNGIDTNLWDPSLFQDCGPGTREKKNFLIGSVGRLCAHKGYDQLLRAGALIINRNPEIPFEIWFIGDGEEKRKLRRLAGKLSLSSRVIFRGSCTDIRPFLSLMDLFVLPSHSEGLPNSVLEAMCMKKAVLLSDIPAHREIASDKVSAFFFRPGNPADLAEKIIDLYRQPQTRSEIGDAARKRILSAFSLPAMLEKYRKIYNKILHGTS